jgi:hypothetical protein
MYLILSAEFAGSPGDDLDKAVAALLNEHEAELLNAGTLLSAEPVRDVEYLLTNGERLGELLNALLALGVASATVWSEEEDPLAA